MMILYRGLLFGATL